jgi:hypothetical protein
VRFAVDPLLAGYAAGPLEVQLTVRAHADQPTGFNLKYEAARPLVELNDHGMRIAGSGWTNVRGSAPVTLTWQLPDPSFAGKYGANVAIDCDVPRFCNLSVVSATITPAE